VYRRMRRGSGSNSDEKKAARETRQAKVPGFRTLSAADASMAALRKKAKAVASSGSRQETATGSAIELVQQHRQQQQQEAPLPLVTWNGAAIPNIKHALSDSYIIPGFSSIYLGLEPSKLFGALQDTAPWTDPEDPDFMYRGRELARQKAFLTVSDDLVPRLDMEPSVMPRYGYPGFQHGSMRAYRDVRTVPQLHNMVETFQERLCYFGLPVEINHLILTRYRGAEDNIGYHSDKMKDIQRGTPIISLSLGEEREFHFGTPDPANPKMQTITTHRFVLKSGDLFILGPQTNAAYRHAVVPVDQEVIIKRAKNAEVKPRISIVLRDIHTMITREEARKRAAKTEEARKIRDQEKKHKQLLAVPKPARKTKTKKGGRRTSSASKK
jgi:alkylated DNA repair dioxygenase AlkB